MLKTHFIFFSVVLAVGGTTLRRDSNVIYFDDDTLEMRHSRSMLSDIAHELLQRSASSSQVLNLNLSNLLLLLVLKAIVYGAGFIGNHNFKGRQDDGVEDNLMSEGEVALALGYLIGDTCLYRAACEVPQTAKEYLGAAEIIFETMKLAPQIIPIDENSYAKTMLEFQKAIDHGSKGQCPSEYSCKKENVNRFLRPQ